MSPHLKKRPLQLLDPAMLDTWASAELDTDIPGAALPADFPREGQSPDQLVAIEDWWLAKTRVATLRLFSLIHTTRDGGAPTATSVLHCVAVLAKLMGYNESQSWKELAESLGTSPQSLCLLKQAISHKMSAFMGSPTPGEYARTARVLARQARKHRLLAAILSE